jgi:predicted lipoprotein with Yx(FWY)xxD motif
MKSRITISIAAAMASAIGLIASGCGGPANGSSYSSSPYGYPVATNAATGIAAAGVGVASSPLGRIVVDSTGRTLYVFEKDKSHSSSCYGLCAAEWTPLLTHGKLLARAGARQSLLGAIRRADAGEQVSYAGHPLYRFVGDRKPGETRGEGLQSFGAGWDAISPAGKKIESDD